VSASVNLPLQHKVQRFSSLLTPARLGGPGKRAVKRLRLVVVFQNEWGDNLNSSNKRCTTVYKQPRTNILSSMYNHSRSRPTYTRSQSLPQKEVSDSTPLI